MSYTNQKKATTKKNERIPLLLSGDMRVFPKERSGFIFYSSSLSVKDGKDTSRFFFDVRFTKKNDPGIEDPFDIRINKSFLTFSEYNDNQRLTVVVQDFDLI